MKKAVFAPRSLLDLLFAAAVPALLLLRGQAVAEGVRQGLVFAGGTLLPALFPFLILSEWLTRSGAGERLTRPLAKPVARLTGLSPAAASALLIGLVCGTPVCCLQAAALYKEGRVGRGDRDRLFLFGNNPGLGFTVGAVGGVCGDRRLGFYLWLIVTGAAFFLCALSRFLFSKEPENADIPRNGIEKSGFDLPACVASATAAMVRVLGFCLAAAGLLGGLSFLTAHLSPLLQAVFRGVTELGAGVAAAAALSPRAAFVCCAFLCGFVGLTVALQLRSLADGAAPPLPLYLAARLCVSALSTAAAWGLWRFCRRAVPTAALTVPAAGLTLARTSFSVLFLSVLLLSAMGRLPKRQK